MIKSRNTAGLRMGDWFLSGISAGAGLVTIDYGALKHRLAASPSANSLHKVYQVPAFEVAGPGRDYLRLCYGGLLNPQLFQEPGVVKSSLAQNIKTARRSSVAARHIGLKDNAGWLPVRSHPRHVFCRFPVHDLAVVIAGLDEDFGIGGGLDVLVGRVGSDVAVFRFLLWVAPLQELADGQGKRLVVHRIDDVHKRH